MPPPRLSVLLGRSMSPRRRPVRIDHRPRCPIDPEHGILIDYADSPSQRGGWYCPHSSHTSATPPVSAWFNMDRDGTLRLRGAA